MAEHRPITVLIVSASSIFRAGLRHVLENDPDISVGGYVYDASSAVEQVRKHTPNVIVMDMDLPRIDVAEIIEQVAGYSPDTRYIAVLGAS